MDIETLKSQIISKIAEIDDCEWYENPNEQHTFIAQIGNAYTVKIHIPHGNNVPFAQICNAAFVGDSITETANRLMKIKRERLNRREIESIQSIARGLGFKF